MREIHAQPREPSLNLVLAGLLGYGILVSISVALNLVGEPWRYIGANAAFIGLSGFLFFQAFRHSGAKIERGEWVTLIGLFAVVLAPLMMKLVADVFKASPELPPAVRIVEGAAIVAIVVSAFIISAVRANEARKTISQYITLPVGVLSLVLFLGGPSWYDFLRNVIPGELLTLNSILRYFVGGLLVLTILLDVGFSFNRGKRSISLALNRERKKLRDRLKANPVVIRRSSALGRFLQFNLIDLTNQFVLASRFFTTGIFVVGRAAGRSIKGIWTSLHQAAVAITLLIFLLMFVQSQVEASMVMLGRSPWNAGEGWPRFLTWSAYFLWVGVTSGLFASAARLVAADLRFSVIAVIAFVVCGIWIGALAATLSSLALFPALRGFRSLSPFLVAGLILMLIAILQTKLKHQNGTKMTRSSIKLFVQRMGTWKRSTT